MKKIIILLSIVCFWGINLYPIILGNEVPPLPVPGEKEATLSSHEGYVKQGASFYFLARLEINRYFSIVEIEGMEASKESLKNARIQLGKAIYWFNLARDKASLTREQEEKFKNFDYTSFLNNPQYHRQTMESVVSYFKDADIKAFFNQIVVNLTEISSQVEEMENGNFNKDDLWRLYELSSNSFGHYGTVISNTIFK